jgi:hypothetical protein
MLIYDQPLGFQPSWVETSADGEGLRIIGLDGREMRVGGFFREINNSLAGIKDVLLVRMEKNEPVEGWNVPFVTQQYF